MRPRVVVIEGPDGAGKTTLASRIAQHYGFEVRHEGPPPEDRPADGYYLHQLFDAVLLTFARPGVVLDRFALGERVYGPIVRGRDRLGPDGWTVIRAELDRIGAVRVLCLPPYDACRDAWYARNRARGEMIRSEETFRRTYRAWQGMDRPDLGGLRYDWTSAGDPFTRTVVPRLLDDGALLSWAKHAASGAAVAASVKASS